MMKLVFQLKCHQTLLFFYPSFKHNEKKVKFYNVPLNQINFFNQINIFQ